MTSELNELVCSGLKGKEDMSVDEGILNVLFLLSGPKMGCPDKRKICYGGALRRAKFHVYRDRSVEIQPQNCQNFEFWP